MDDFGGYVASSDSLVVQPRMGFSDPETMRTGLAATAAAHAATVGTITLDSFTRVGDLDTAARAVRAGSDLNGYPILTHGSSVTERVLADSLSAGFPVQVRHGSALAHSIVERLVQVGLTATEGGPISYCLPYGRTPIAEAVTDWARTCETLAAARTPTRTPHLETFGGCLMGQLCPPSLLIAVSILEGMFFAEHGLTSVSLSYAQQTDERQDREALTVLRRLAARYLPNTRWHVVVYAYMGVYPTTIGGATDLLGAAARLAVDGSAERLIVKTVAESKRIPTIEQNVAALEHASATAAGRIRAADADIPQLDSGIEDEALALVEGALDCHRDIDVALVRALNRGIIDIPYCLHPDNSGRARAVIDGGGRLQWSSIGAMPLPVRTGATTAMSSSALLDNLHHVQMKFDVPHLPVAATAGTAEMEGASR